MILSVSSQSVQREIPTRVTTLVQGQRNRGQGVIGPLNLAIIKRKPVVVGHLDLTRNQT